MNKKFLNAILFGALMVTSTGTFVSCKDYDDDIDEINNKISGIESTVADLQKKIGDGAYVKSIASVANGFAVTMSDGSSTTITVKDGVNGENGKDGTEWTISEDGFWVCNGEKTTVQAVGKDGEKGEAGKDGQKEVEKRADGWYLWNGTDYEKVTVDTPATVGVPYYQIDPKDENYAIMYIYDKTGKEEQAVRLPLNEGLVQLIVRNMVGSLDINFAKAKADIKWDGKKAAPKKGEYIITQSFDSLLVQVNPTNFDLASIKDLALMTSKNVKVPVTLGAPVAFNGVLSPATSRAVSEGGLYKMSVTPDAITEENVKLYGKSNSYNKPYVSLVANDKVRSSYEVAFSLNEVKTSMALNFGVYDEYGTFTTTGIRTKAEEPITIVTDQPGYLYDAYLTVADAYKADSIRYELVTDKTMTIQSNEKAQGWIDFVVHYVDTYGTVYPTAEQIKAKNVPTVRVYFGETYENETNTSIASTSHTAISCDYNKNPEAQSMLVDFSGYFKDMSASDRTLWNSENGTYFDWSPNRSFKVQWTWTDKDGKTHHNYIYDLVQYCRLADKDGKLLGEKNLWDNGRFDYTSEDKAKFAKLYVQFRENYGNGLSEFGNGQLVLSLNLTNSDKKVNETIEIPFEIKNPTAEEQKKHYSFNSHYYSNGVFSVIDAIEVNMADMITTNEYDYSIDFNNLKVVESDENYIYRNGYSTIKLSENGKKGTAYSVEGIVFYYMNRPIELDAVKVKFVTSKKYTVASGGAISFQSGKVENATVTYEEKAVAKEAFYKVTDALGTFVAVDKIQSVRIVEFVSPKNGENKDLLYEPAVSEDGKYTITVKSTGEKATVDSAVTIKIKVVVDGEEYDGKITVNIKAFPTAE